MSYSPTFNDLQQLKEHFRYLQGLDTVEDLNRWVKMVTRSVPAEILAARRSASESTRSAIDGLIPAWSYPFSARVLYDNHRDFIICLSNGYLARWDFDSQCWHPASWIETQLKRLRYCLFSL